MNELTPEEIAEIDRLKPPTLETKYLCCTKRIAELEAEVAKLREALRRVEPKADAIIEIMRREGLKIEDHNDPMQKLAFTIYTELVEAAEIAKAALLGSGE